MTNPLPNDADKFTSDVTTPSPFSGNAIDFDYNPKDITTSSLNDLSILNLDSMEIILAEMRSLFQTTWQSSDTLDQKALLLVAASVVVLSLTTIFQVSFGINDSDLYWFIISNGIIFYALSVGFALWAVRPQKHKLPISTNMTELNVQILRSTKKEAIYQLLESYGEQTQHNLKIVSHKSFLIRWSAIFLSISVLIFFLSVFFRG